LLLAKHQLTKYPRDMNGQNFDYKKSVLCSDKQSSPK